MNDSIDLPGLPDADSAALSHFAHKSAAPAQQQAEAAHFSSPGQYRIELFSIWEDDFIIKFERNVEPRLFHRGTKPYPHAITVMRALRILLRLRADKQTGDLNWGGAVDRFTEDGALMIRREDLLRACRVFKPSMTKCQVRLALETLRRYGIIWSKQGRPRAGSKHCGSPGTVMYLRVNTGRLTNLLSGQHVVKPVSTPKPNSFYGSVKGTERLVVYSLHSSSAELPTSPVTAIPATVVNSIEPLDWMMTPKGTPAATPQDSSQASSKNMEISERERVIIDLLIKTPHLFPQGKDEGWSSACTEENHITVGQVLRIRELMHRKILTLEFVQDLIHQSFGGSTGPGEDDKRPWWVCCTFSYFLKKCWSVRRALYGFMAQESVDIHEASILHGEITFEEEFCGEVFSVLAMLPGKLTSADLRQLSTVPPRGVSQEPVARTTEDRRRALIGIMAVMNHHEVENLRPGALQEVTRATRDNVISWMRQAPRHAEHLIRTIPHFRFWFGIDDAILSKITCASANILNARQGRSFVVNRLLQGWY